MNLQKLANIKNFAFYYFDDILKLRDFGHNNILLDKKKIILKYFDL